MNAPRKGRGKKKRERDDSRCRSSLYFCGSARRRPSVKLIENGRRDKEIRHFATKEERARGERLLEVICSRGPIQGTERELKMGAQKTLGSDLPQ